MEEDFLLYKSARPEVDVAVFDSIEPHVRAAVEQRKGLAVAEIEAFSVKAFVRNHPEAEEGLRHATAAVGLDADEADVVFCEWAAVHEDGSYRGSSFVSLVLSTGKNPYSLQTVRTRSSTDPEGFHEFGVFKQSLILRQGDLFVFDPTVPHMAAPTRPADGQLLVLLQWVMPTETREQCEKLKARFAPQGDTENIRDLMAMS